MVRRLETCGRGGGTVRRPCHNSGEPPCLGRRTAVVGRGFVMRVCKRVHYSGRVQGVGFRYAAARLAGDFDVAGFVRNLPDGRVELAAEGEANEVQKFLDALARQMAGYIAAHTIHDEPPADYRGFEIR